MLQLLTFGERPFVSMASSSPWSDYRVGVVDWVSNRALGVRLEHCLSGTGDAGRLECDETVTVGKYVVSAAPPSLRSSCDPHDHSPLDLY